MALTREEKATQLTELKEKMGKTQSIIFAHYIGLKVAQVSTLRRELKKGKAEMKVGKKTLMSIAAKDQGLPALLTLNLSGPVACIFSFADPLSGAQIAFKFSKDHQQVALIGGIFDGKVLSKEEAIAFAKIPGRMELFAQFASMLRAPLCQFASMCNAPLTGFARALSELSQKKSPPPVPNS